MKEKMRKIVLITLLIVGGVPSLVGYVVNSNEKKYQLDQVAFAQTAGYYRLDLQCFYRCGWSMCFGSQCAQSGTGCNVYSMCSA